ncbi:MAG: hypothetical protein BWX56_00011 [Euryarchaeota archaeon ADurb.Bin023]|jgi:hypothetical protein|nr:MAG: hypothetical protein BWX56_00011 [Euryarchaeota archaeon ADurb.Bin023]HNZ59916.1 hypothetical protein [Methanofastidiosum sp.]HPX24746.1 hypothetical protein [Methanofastidiosum sp.]HQC25084.1 hypothetical protein [Methanofastidiosum sp.]
MFYLSEGWAIFIAGSILTICILVITYRNNIIDKIKGNGPNVCLFAYTLDRTYSMDELKKLFPNPVKTQISCVKSPSKKLIKDPTVPFAIGIWNYSEKEDLLQIIIENMGTKIAKNIKIDLSFLNPLDNSIEDIIISQENRIQKILGGNGSFVSFKLEELLPEETQKIDIVYSGEGLEDIQLWVENEKFNSKEKIWIFRIDYEG